MEMEVILPRILYLLEVMGDKDDLDVDSLEELRDLIEELDLEKKIEEARNKG